MWLMWQMGLMCPSYATASAGKVINAQRECKNTLTTFPTLTTFIQLTTFNYYDTVRCAI